MKHIKFTCILIEIAFLASFISCADVSYGNLINRNVNRNIDLTSQFAKHALTITLENAESTPVSSFYLAIETKYVEHLSYLDVTSSGTQLKVSNEEKDKSSEGKKITFSTFKVDLKNALESKGTVDVLIKAVFTHMVTPFPSAITQFEKQLVKFSDNHFFFSPYTTATQTTTVKLSSGNIESKTEKSPTSTKGDTITYGPYADIAAYSHSTLNVHYENNRPFLTVTKLTKELEVSHWGNLAVEATYDVLRDDGATLKGTFSRYDYQRNPGGSPAVVPVLRTYLPLTAADVYYRDEIGNITTSNMNVNQRGLVVELTPRFPLFGGWKTAFYMGYNLPINQFLFTDAKDSSLYVLNATFAVTTDDIVVDELVVRVILPEGAKNIEVHTPFGVDSQGSATHFTYLDTSGRPVVIINKKNVVSEHDRFFQVTYNFTTFGMFREPLLLVGAFFVFFLTVMAYARFNFRIGPVKTRSANADRLDDILSRFKDFTDQRAEQHSQLDSALNKLWKSRSESQYNTDRRKLEQNLQVIKKEIGKIIIELEEVDIESSRKIRDLEKKQDKKALQQDQVHQNEINYRISKKIPKSTYEDLKTEYERLYSAIDEEIELIVNDLIENL